MNEVILIGRLTKDPELRYTANTQMPVCMFTLAVDRPKSRDKQNNSPTADFIRITALGKTGENCSKYLSKGRQTAVQGRIQTGSYKDKDGKTVYTTDVLANMVDFIGSRGSDNRQPEQQEYPGFEAIDEADVPF